MPTVATMDGIFRYVHEWGQIPPSDHYDFLGSLVENFCNPWTLLGLTWAVIIPAILLFPIYRPRLVFVGDKRKVDGMMTRSVGNVRKGRTACITLFNCKSGGQLGRQVFEMFQKCLPTHQVYDLSVTRPEAVLELWKGSEGNIRLLVCGGDGTAGWVMNAVDKVFGTTDRAETRKQFPIAILPLGTGNDLARSFGWGGGLKTGDVNKTLAFDYCVGVAKADVVMMDRWHVKITNKKGITVVDTNFNNYFSIGLDAKIAMKFHEQRNANPEQFTSVSKNKFIYAMYGVESLVDGTSLGDGLKLTDAEGKNRVRVNPLWSGLVISNVPSYSGGKNFWGSDPDPRADSYGGFDKPLVPVSPSDGLLEVMAISGTLHIGLVQIDFDSAIRLAQLPSISISVSEPVCVQMDGEPIPIEAGRIVITRHEQYPMLNRGKGHSFILEDVDEVGFGPRPRACKSKPSDAQAHSGKRSEEVLSQTNSPSPSSHNNADDASSDDDTTDFELSPTQTTTIAEALTFRQRLQEANDSSAPADDEVVRKLKT